MKTKAILGISLGAVFAISMIMSPAFAGASEGTIVDAILKDHAAGKNPANNPDHFELTATAAGNWTQFAVNTVDLTPLSPGDIGAVGFGMINDDGYFHGFTSHDFDDCIASPEDCSGFLPHGHGAQLIAPTANCTAISADAEIDGSTIVDLGEAKVKVADDESSTQIELDDIPADAPLDLNETICSVDEVEDVEPVAQFHIEVGAGGELCVFVDGGVVADGQDGPDDDKNKNKNGGFVCEV